MAHGKTLTAARAELNVSISQCAALLSTAGDKFAVVAPLSLCFKKQQRLKLVLAVCQPSIMATPVRSATAFAETKTSNHAQQKPAISSNSAPAKLYPSISEREHY